MARVRPLRTYCSATRRSSSSDFLQNMAVMPLVCTVYQIVRVVQHHAFDGGGAHVKSNFQLCFLLLGKRLRQQFSTANRMIPH